MSAVNITNVTVLDNPASFLTPFQFEIAYECVTPLKDGMCVCVCVSFPKVLSWLDFGGVGLGAF